MSALLPDRLKASWRAVEAGVLDAQECAAQEQQELDAYRERWRGALLVDGHQELRSSLLDEICAFTGGGREEVERRCSSAVETLAAQWRAQVDVRDAASIERYYDRAGAYLYDLMWWHALEYDLSPLAYVNALEFAGQRGCRRYLDFGSGVGAGALLFGRHGLQVALADVSSELLAFSRWRLARRGQPARFFDLKHDKLPDSAFDLITAMDVFEHLVDPVEAVDQLQRALAPGGYLLGRFHAEADASHPQHIVHDFSPTFERLREHGFAEVWRDEWLWGHQIFRKPGGTDASDER
jgi:SAM-dependent methyltransferase